MKRIITLIAVIMAVFSITACTTKETATEKLETLTWYLPGENFPDQNLVQDEVNKITEEAIGATVNIQFIATSAYNERMKMNMAAKADYDICFTGAWNPYPDAVKRGGFLELTDLINKQTPELWKTIPDYGWEAVKINEDVYAVPNLQTYTQTVGLYFQKELVDKYKFDVNLVKELKDIEPFLKKIKENEPNIYPFKAVNGWTGILYKDFEGLMPYANLLFFSKDGSDKIVSYSDMPNFSKIVELLRDWYLKGYIRPDVATTNESADYLAGKYACGTSAWGYGSLAEESIRVGREMVGVNLFDPYMTRAYATATMAAISKNSAHAEKSIKFIELLNTNSELYNMICYGIEDKHYKKISDNRIEVFEESGYKPNSSWKFGNNFKAWLVQGQPDDIWEQRKEDNETAKRSSILGLAFNTENVESEITNCRAIFGEYFTAIATGSQDPSSYYDTFLSRLKEAGVDKIRDDAQHQVDAFLNKK